MNDEKQVVFTLEEVNGILGYLGEIPAKYSIDLIKFIRDRAQAQHPADAAPVAEAPAA